MLLCSGDLTVVFLSCRERIIDGIMIAPVLRETLAAIFFDAYFSVLYLLLLVYYK